MKGVAARPSREQVDDERVKAILKKLRAAYPNVITQLHHRSPFELLVATILSAQCTDNQVNKITVVLFEKLSRPQDFIDVPVETLEQMIRSAGYYRNKARNIKNCAAAIAVHHQGEVPRTLEELVRLPGVGRKTANVVLGAAFNIPGMVVDTHVARIANRLGLTTFKDPVKIEFDLMAQIPRLQWRDFGLRLIYLGREYCRARKPRCEVCPLAGECGRMGVSGPGGKKNV